MPQEAMGAMADRLLFPLAVDVALQAGFGALAIALKSEKFYDLVRPPSWCCGRDSQMTHRERR